MRNRHTVSINVTYFARDLLKRLAAMRKITMAETAEVVFFRELNRLIAEARGRDIITAAPVFTPAEETIMRSHRPKSKSRLSL